MKIIWTNVGKMLFFAFQQRHIILKVDYQNKKAKLQDKSLAKHYIRNILNRFFD
jgi:hypothetical protein